MKHIKMTSKVRGPQKANMEIPIVGDLLCRLLPEKDKGEE